MNLSVWWDVLNDEHENWNQQINKLKNKTKHNTIKQKDHQQQQQQQTKTKPNKQTSKKDKQTKGCRYYYFKWKQESPSW